MAVVNFVCLYLRNTGPPRASSGPGTNQISAPLPAKADRLKIFTLNRKD